jgi:hypothetical protein
VSDFFKSLLLGSTEEPSNIFKKKLMELCPNAVTVEWYLDGRVHEAILMEHGQEKIVRFHDDGNLIDIRVNLTLTEVPANIRNEAEKAGEIMSSIRILDEESVKYEFVLRDKSMKREILFMNEHAEIIRRRDFPEII